MSEENKKTWTTCEFFGQMIPIARPPQSWCYAEGNFY